MSRSIFWKKATPAVLSAAVALTSMPVAALAATEDVVIEDEIAVVEDVELGSFSEEQVSAGGYVFGTINLPYADFFYGELQNVEPDAQMQLDKSNPVTAAGYRDTGMYGNSKFQRSCNCEKSRYC